MTAIPTSAEPTPLLQAHRLQKRFGTWEVLRGVDLELEPGEVAVILGENGAGKTTLLRILGGDLLPDTGSVRVAGHDLHAAGEAARQALIYVAQHPPLAPLLSLREHAEAVVAFRSLDPARAERDLLEVATALRLDHALDRPIRALSGGMAHKAALVLAFVARARLVLLDEPHAGLDVRSALALRALILDRRDRDTAFVLASHLAEATLAVADRAIVLHRGRIGLDLGKAALEGFDGDARAFEQAVLQAMSSPEPGA